MREIDYKKGKKIIVSDKMQSGYSYVLSEDLNSNFNKEFNPELTPKEMLEMGVFEGKYLNDCKEELPEEWFENSLKMRSETPNPKLNKFGVKSRMSLNAWKEKKWIINEDPRGWFQWYCRYYIGRREKWDEIQIKRWKNFKRHKAQLIKNCSKKDFDCRKKQRQALLQWAYDPMI